MKLGQLFRSLREGRALKQAEISDKLKKTIRFSQSKLSDIETEKIIPNFVETCKIGEILGIKPNEIWDKIKDEAVYNQIEEFIGQKKFPKSK